MASAVAATIAKFRAAGKMRCRDVCAALEALGFEVRTGGGPGHKVVAHKRLVGFHGTNFNCSHGRNPEVIPQYVKSLAKVLEKWQTEIEAL